MQWIKIDDGYANLAYAISARALPDPVPPGSGSGYRLTLMDGLTWDVRGGAAKLLEQRLDMLVAVSDRDMTTVAGKIRGAKGHPAPPPRKPRLNRPVEDPEDPDSAPPG